MMSVLGRNQGKKQMDGCPKAMSQIISTGSVNNILFFSSVNVKCQICGLKSPLTIICAIYFSNSNL
jgi:hypothetical protein